MDAILLLNKKSGITSFSCLNNVKKIINKKTGHCGTLDKFASGLIISCSGKYTKSVPLFTGFDKIYNAKIKFGEETDTLDPEGKVIFKAEIPSLKKIEESLTKLAGKIIQIPPVYSAIHVGGKRSYQIARSGNEIKHEGREVFIYSYKLISYENALLNIILHVSKGTYIRSYARDLGLLCGSRAYLSGLVRTQIGPFSLSNAIDYDDVTAINESIHKDIDLYSEDLLSKAKKYAISEPENRIN